MDNDLIRDIKASKAEVEKMHPWERTSMSLGEFTRDKPIGVKKVPKRVNQVYHENPICSGNRIDNGDEIFGRILIALSNPPQYYIESKEGIRWLVEESSILEYVIAKV